MLKTVIVLANGTEIYSGSGENAIQSTTIKQQVNNSKQLTLGSTCAAMLDARLLTKNGALAISEGEEVTVYKEAEDGARYLIGMFILQKPTRPSANTMRLTAYDRITRLDRDLTDWLAGLTGWPYPLLTFADMVCESCGLSLANDSIPNGDYQVQAFSAQGITGRKLIQWVGEACGRFCRATPEGQIEFAWYEPSGIKITPNGNRFYYQNGLTYEDYAVAPVEKVQIKLTQNDVGAVWPNEPGDKNTYIIAGNYLLTTSTTEALVPIAKSIHNQLKNVTYTPCKVQLPAGMDVHAGNTVEIIDKNGNAFTAYIMTKTQSGQRDTLECTGSYRRDTTTVVNNQILQSISGKVLEINANVEGLSITAKEIKKSAVFIPEITGQYSNAVKIKNALADSIEGLTLYGKTTQNGTPSPENPVELVSVGASGKVDTVVTGSKNLFGGEVLADKLVAEAKATKDEVNGTVRYSASGMDGVILFRPPKQNTRYTIMLYGMNTDATRPRCNMCFVYTDGTYDVLNFKTAGELSYCIRTSNANKQLRSVSGFINAGYTTLYYDKCGIFEGVLTEADFEPFIGSALTVSTPNGLSGIPVSSGGNYTDENGQQCICDEIDFARGVYVKRIGKRVFDGTLVPFDFNVSDKRIQYFTANVDGAGLPKTPLAILSNSYVTSVDSSIPNRIELYTENTTTRLLIFDTRIGETITTKAQWMADLAARKQNGNPLVIMYALATPIETPLSTEELSAFAALGNPAGIVTVYSQAPLSVELAGMASVSSVKNAQEAANNAQADADAANTQLQSIHESISELVVDSDLIRASVKNVEGTIAGAFGDMETIRSEMASMKLDADSLNVEIQKITNDGVKKVTTTTGVFDETGLLIDRTDSPTQTQITPDGMTVYRKAYGGQSEVLSATSDGVDATNLHAKTYLIVGSRSRFENYGSNRTGCFWIGG